MATQHSATIIIRALDRSNSEPIGIESFYMTTQARADLVEKAWASKESMEAFFASRYGKQVPGDLPFAPPAPEEFFRIVSSKQVWNHRLQCFDFTYEVEAVIYL